MTLVDKVCGGLFCFFEGFESNYRGEDDVHREEEPK
eukprot:COSAG06_NODE_2783_length_6290_cov_3.541916_8_plen_36_part_00